MKKFAKDFIVAVGKTRNLIANDILELLDNDKTFAKSYDRVFGRGKRNSPAGVSRCLNSAIRRSKGFRGVCSSKKDQNLTNFMLFKKSDEMFNNCPWTAEELFEEKVSEHEEEATTINLEDRKNEIVLCKAKVGESNADVLFRVKINFGDLSDEACSAMGKVITEILQEDDDKQNYFYGDDLSHFKYLDPTINR